MWEWFVTNGIWIILAVVAGLGLFLLLKRWARQSMEKLVPEGWQEQLKNIQKGATWAITGTGGVILALAVAAVITSRYGIDIVPALGGVGTWLLEHGILILVIIILSYLAYAVARATVPRLIERSVTVRGKGRRAREDLAKRTHTLSNVITPTVGVFIGIVAVFMVLSEVGVDIAPLLAGAGVIGIALGFGTQSLIRDLLSGFFILLEDQYRKGDWVSIAGVDGLVEEANLRRTVLRDFNGTVHTIPNGEVKVASNYTKDWARVNLNIPVAYGEDLEQVMEIINRVGQELTEDEHFGPLITSSPKALRVENFADSAIEIKVLGETKPMQQWAVTGELRMRIKKAFDNEGIEIPWPHIKLYFGESGGADLACKSCAHISPPGSKFCSNCGARLGS